MIPVTDAYPALLRLTLRCSTCHGGVGVLLGCFIFLLFFFFGQLFFFSSFVFLDRGLPTMLAVLFVLERLVFFSCMFSVDKPREGP